MFFSSVFAPPASSLSHSQGSYKRLSQIIIFLAKLFFTYDFWICYIVNHYFFSTWLWIQMNRVELSNPHSTHRFSTRYVHLLFPRFFIFLFFLFLILRFLEEWRPVTVWRADRCKREFCVAATSPKIILLDLNGTRITGTFLVHYSCSSNECFRIRNVSCSVSKLFKQ